MCKVYSESMLTYSLNTIAIPFLTALLFILFFVYASGIFQWLRIVYYTLGRDLTGLLKLILTKIAIYRYHKNNSTVPKIFKTLANKHPNKIVFYHNDTRWTFKQLDEFSNKVANCFIKLGFKSGDEIALFMDSKPEYIGLWLGLSKAGIVTALINTYQRKESLVHSIHSINSKALIYGSELEEAVLEASEKMNSIKNLKYFVFGDNNESSKFDKAINLKQLLHDESIDDPVQIEKGNYTDKLLYIYTSGTTGLPKAAVIRHCRYLFVSSGVYIMLGLTRNETIYTSIPLYHLSGGIIGSGLCLIYGNSMAMRHKFSAKMFWQDCIKYKCTVAQYIGEICRYLLAQPQSPFDRAHKVKTMFGNGLRPSIWKNFVERFQIKNVCEFYGATEGNANVVNLNNTIGSCGFVSQILPGSLTDLFYPVSIIRVDESTGEPIRNRNGLCIRCKPGETGEFVGRIYAGDPTRAFDGYADKAASEKKILRNVFRKNDAFFSSGDLLTLDEFGNVFFKDRTGDTFRWKGENVSTTEIEALISKKLEHCDCVVYGVEIPGCEGRAGMAAIVDPINKVDINKLLKEMKSVLPNYSIPTFLRKTSTMDRTGTFKLPKIALRNQGFNPSVILDPLFYYDVKQGQYLPLDNNAYDKIINGQIRF